MRNRSTRTTARNVQAVHCGLCGASYLAVTDAEARRWAKAHVCPPEVTDGGLFGPDGPVPLVDISQAQREAQR